MEDIQEVQEVQESIPAEEVQENTDTKIVIDPDTTIFVGNLASSCTEEDLYSLFSSEAGGVKVDIPPARQNENISSNGYSRKFHNKFAFVTFPEKIDMDKILEKYDQQVIKDKAIFIRKGLSPEERDAAKGERMANRRGRGGSRGSFRGSFRGDKGNFRGGSYNSRGGSYRGSTSRGSFRGGRGGSTSVPPRKEKTPLNEMERSTDTLYVNNIPYYANKHELAHFFGINEEDVVLPMRRMRDQRTKRVFFSKRMNRGIAFVTFTDPNVDIIKKSEEFQGKVFQDRAIVVDVAALKPVFPGDNANEEITDGLEEEQKPDTAAAINQDE
ncbi:hypothetical protein TPHA_0K02300 [Tetrapisispora phaffii CBS 4417]|uniref:RRM domain-containing protein n=1 Tax=Tetrapisispora phaffii (strain ATCC 24235 / CBS 4417 / NBRC 1672 / NRRL Y-8282 / UCD 70-5) TaxID=1071381 RepID=G8BZN2_TETPH|nr:hypothetical protein TPHA_0K02300 [Tetrapisispora phaffii CBS 4417]CCE65360.1 hypothetical protein TPHA_0K02300 [Tetrapisispora phaffii CBS 4417]